VGAAVGPSGGAGDVGFAVAAVVSDGGVAQDGGDGRAVAGSGLMSVFTEGDIANPVEPVLDVPLSPDSVLQVGGLGVFGRQGHDKVGGFAGGLGVDGAGAGDADSLFGVGEAEPAGGAHGERFDGAGLAAAVTGVAAAVPDRHLRPGQPFELGEDSAGD
jgi:hypothetical protein